MFGVLLKLPNLNVKKTLNPSAYYAITNLKLDDIRSSVLAVYFTILKNYTKFKYMQIRCSQSG